MCTPLLTLRIRSRRDILAARQRARQLAGLLHFSPRRQYAIAATVFELALDLARRPGGGTLRFELHGDTLHAFACDPQIRMSGEQCLVELLPDPEQAPALEDLPWLIEQLTWYTPLNLFDEIRQQNRMLLDALQELEARAADSHRPAA